MLSLGCEANDPAYKNNKENISEDIPISNIADFIRLSHDNNDFIPELEGRSFEYVKTNDVTNYEDYLAVIDSFIMERYCMTYCSEFNTEDMQPLFTSELYNAITPDLIQFDKAIGYYNVVLFPKIVEINPGNILKVYDESGITAINATIYLYTRADKGFYDDYAYLRQGLNFVWLWIYVDTELKIINWSEDYGDNKICFAIPEAKSIVEEQLN